MPIGSCEQHGPHLPLDTDTRIAVAIAERVAEVAVPGRMLVAPAIGVTSSGEHAGFPGTLSIGLEATELVLVELVRSADWSGGVVFVNGHGGNRAAVENALTIVTAEDRSVMSWWPRIRRADAHAGRTETSLMLAIAPELVRLSAAEQGDVTPVAELFERLTEDGVRAVSPNGVLGDPTGASADEGKRLFDALVVDASLRIGAWTASLGR